MRNKLYILSACMLAMSLAGCGSDSQRPISTGSAEQAASAAAASAQEDITIEPQELLNYNGLTITAESYEHGGLFGDEINVLIDNQSDQNYGVSLNAVIVNNYMVTSLFSEQVTSGNKDNASIDLYSTELSNAGIEHIGQIELYFYLFNPDTYETVYTADPVTIQTSQYDEMDTTPNDDGKELYSQDGIRIVGKYVDDDSIWGTGVVLYLENNTEQNIMVQCDNISVNGYMMTPFFSSDVYAHKMAIDEITIMQSDLDNNGISEVSDVQLAFNIINADTYMNITTTDTIDFTVE